jgi:hypothetical protein
LIDHQYQQQHQQHLHLHLRPPCSTWRVDP